MNLTPRLPFVLLGPRQGVGLAIALILLVAVLDALTGYALRLAILYLLPITLAAWSAGTRAGYAAALLASLLWLLSFSTEHNYTHAAFYFWEAGAMFFSFLAFAGLSARLRLALNQADERFFRVLDEMQAAVYVSDEKHDTLVYANPGMQQLAGMPIDLVAFERRFEGVDAGKLRLAAQEEGFSSGVVRDGDSGRWYLRQTGPIPWGVNALVRLKVLTDITEQKNAERLREKHLEMMHQSAQISVLAETAATLAHEINQPLMVIATYTDACQRLLKSAETSNEEVATVLAKCHVQAVRAASIIERLRDFIRQRQQQTAACDIGSLLVEACDVVAPMLEETGIELICPLELPHYIVEIDRILLIQVLVNLLRNAIEALRDVAVDGRRIEVDVSTTTDNVLHVSVSDNGPGVPVDMQEKVFQPFFSSKPEGLGLGLTICRSVVEAHYGSLLIAGRPGGGAVFHLSLPCHRT